jgi:hypothetical protein
MDWESDSSVGLRSIPVADNVTDDLELFPCPTEEVERGDGRLSAGAVAGIVVGVTLLAVLVMAAVLVTVLLLYHRTRDVKKKANGAISIEERSLLPSSERKNIPGLGASPFSSLPASTTTATDTSTPYARTSPVALN